MGVKRFPELKGGVPTNWQELRDESVREIVSIKPLTKNQVVYIKALESSIVTIVYGPAGTGKTAVACGIAAKWLREGKIKKVVITRPLVSCGRGMGWLPGTMEEKVNPFMRPIVDAFGEFLRVYEIEKYINDKTIEIIPLEFMRGLTLKNAFIICDEAQNAEFAQLHMLLTRIGKNSKMVITGDISITQTDLLSNGPNPLSEVVRKIKKKGENKDVSIVQLTREDIVRHKIVQWLDEALTEEGDDMTSWLKELCPGCGKANWLELPESYDLEKVKCWKCQKVFQFPEYEGEDSFLVDDNGEGFLSDGLEKPT